MAKKVKTERKPAEKAAKTVIAQRKKERKKKMAERIEELKDKHWFQRKDFFKVVGEMRWIGGILYSINSSGEHNEMDGIKKLPKIGKEALGLKVVKEKRMGWW